MTTGPLMRLRDLLAPYGEFGAVAERAIADLSLDHRQISRDTPTAFVALHGSSRHGLQFAEAAVAAGAEAILYDPSGAAGLPLPTSVPVIAVINLRERLSAIAMRLFGAPAAALRVIGVTGTNGKTSTVQLIAQALHHSGHACATLGTLGGGIWPELEAGERTTPDAIAVARFFARMRARGAEFVAMEVSSHALEQGRVNAVPFELAVFTNLTRDHLDYHGTMEAYGAAKQRLFDWPGLRALVSNLDDLFGRRLLERSVAAGRVSRAAAYTLDGQAVTVAGTELLCARQLHAADSGLRFELEVQAQRSACSTRLLGQFNASNLLAVAAVMHCLDIPLPGIATVLGKLDPVTGRMQRISQNDEPLVVVDYAHTPDGLIQALRSVRAHTAGQLHCVFGCGGDRDRGKRPQMGAIAAELADQLVVTDDNPRSEDGNLIVADIVAGIPAGRARVVRDRRQAIELAVAAAQRGDAVLIAGKGHENYQEVAGQKLPFDDATVARAALDRRAA